MTHFIPKTHYEAAVSYLKKVSGFDWLVDRVITALGPEPSYEDFCREVMPEPVKDPAYAANFLNIYFHLFNMNQGGSKIYYIMPELARRLAKTNLNIDSYYLKSPFREIFIQIDPGLFSIKDIDGSTVPIYGFYIFFNDTGEYKKVRIMACSLLKPTLKIPFNDTTYYFRLEIPSGKLMDIARKYIDNNIKEGSGYLQGKTIKNVDYTEEFTSFVFNVLLYLTSKNTDIITQDPIDFKKKLVELKSPAKKRKLEQRLEKSNQYRLFVAGSTLKENLEESKDLQKAGSIGAWKLAYRVRVSGHWRAQWYGSEKEGNKKSEVIWIEDYDKGPQVADLLNRKVVVQ